VSSDLPEQLKHVPYCPDCGASRLSEAKFCPMCGCKFISMGASAPPTPTGSPETAAPDTAAPDTAAPETAAPDTAAPDTAAQDPAAPAAKPSLADTWRDAAERPMARKDDRTNVAVVPRNREFVMPNVEPMTPPPNAPLPEPMVAYTPAATPPRGATPAPPPWANLATKAPTPNASGAAPAPTDPPQSAATAPRPISLLEPEK
jgi:hypothetical protein